MFLTFSNSILLIGVAAAVVPLVLHLLSRARYQSVDWGAMMFLEGFETTHQHTTRLNQVSLLALRMGLIVLLSAALAQPVLQPWSPQADTRAAALRAAEHGRVSCLAGAAACALSGLALLMLAAAGARRGASVRRQVAWLAVAILAGVVAALLSRRASTWQGEARALAALQPGEPRTTLESGGLRPRIDAAILLDCSPSMNFEENGHTRFSLAQAAARQVVSGLHRGDRVSLLLLGQSQSEAELAPSPDLQSVADRIDSAHTSYAASDIAAGLRKAQEALDRDGRTTRDLYVISDRQALSWRGCSDYFMTYQWPEALRKSAASTRIFAVPVGNSDAENIAIEDIELSNPPAIIGQASELEIDVHNYGTTPRAALPLTVYVNGRVAFETTVSVSPNRVARVSVPVRPGVFQSSGSQVVAAEVKTSGLRDDDRLESVVEAIDPIRVLVISGDEWAGSTGDFRSETDFVRLALAPLQSVRGKGADPCKVEVVAEEDWAKAELQRYQVVVLANIERFTTAQARSIEQFVYGGGGLLIAPGNLSRIRSYNDELWRDGSGILPAELYEATSSDGAEATTIVGYDPTTPVLQFLHDRPDLMLSSTIGRFFPVNPRPADAQVLAWYSTGSPFLIESRGGTGKVLLMTTSLGADWSTLPLSNLYLPLVQSAVRHLATGTLPVRNLPLGDPIQVTLSEVLDDHATLEPPDGEPRQVPIVRFGGIGELRFGRTQDPGVYHLRFKDHNGPRTIAFAVHTPRDESDLTQLTEARWAELERGLHLQRIDPNESSIAVTVAGARDGYDLWPWALAALLLAGFIELGLARWWSRDVY